MSFLPLILFSDFIQILHSARKFYTKNYYFYNSKLFSTIALVQKQRLNPKFYSKQELIMELFVWASVNAMNTSEKIQDIIKCRYL
jgi:hypothetical protein